jgi:hypothetical protein
VRVKRGTRIESGDCVSAISNTPFSNASRFSFHLNYLHYDVK